MDADERGLVPYEEGPAPAGGSFTARDVFYVLFRHKWKMISFFTVVVVVGLLAVLSIPKQYRSEGQVLVNMGRNPLTHDEAIDLPVAELPRSLDSEISIMRGRAVAYRVADKLGPKRILKEPELKSPIEKSLNEFRDGLEEKLQELGGGPPEVDPETENAYLREQSVKVLIGGLDLRERDNLIMASFQAPDPELAQDVLQTVMETYVLRHIEVHRPKVEPRMFKEMANNTLAKLEAKEKELEEFRNEYNVSSMPDQLAALLGSIAEREAGMFDLATEIRASKARIQTHEDRLRSLGVATGSSTEDEEGAAPPVAAAPEIPEILSVPDTAMVTQLKRDLVELRKEEAQLATRYPPGNRLLRNKRLEIEQAEKMLEEEKAEARRVYESEIALRAAVSPGSIVPGQPNVVSPESLNRQEIERLLISERAELAGHEAAMQDYESELGRMRRQLASLQAVETDLRRIERELALLEEAYGQNDRALQRSELQQEMARQMVSRVEIIQDATLPAEPYESTRRRNFALVLFAAFFGSLGIAFTLEYLSQTFKTNEDVEKHLGLPVLAAISREEFKRCI